MGDHRIDIYIKDMKALDFQWMLIQFFDRIRTPTSPVYVAYNEYHEIIDDGKEIPKGGLTPFRSKYWNFQVVEASEDESVYRIPLANIIIQSFPPQVVVFIEGIKEHGRDWEKVVKIVRAIISQMELLKYEIETIKPEYLLPKSSLPAWEQIEDQGAHRKILELWHRGYKNTEIAAKVSLLPLSVTNILSALRRQYGEDIVPRADTIRKRRLPKTDDSS